MISLTPPLLRTFFKDHFNCSFDVDKVETLAPPAIGEVQKYKLFTCKPTWHYVNATINGTMTVTEKGDNWMTVASAAELFPGTYTINKPYFLHGTQIATKNYITAILKEDIPYPMIFLQELQRDQVIANRESPFGMTSPCRFWFLLNIRKDEWTTQDRYDLVCKPMFNLAQEVMRQLSNSKFFGEISQDVPSTAHTNIGSTSEFGYLRSLFPQKAMGGIEETITLPVKRRHCNC